jgi:hypothetical protein
MRRRHDPVEQLFADDDDVKLQGQLVDHLFETGWGCSVDVRQIDAHLEIWRQMACRAARLKGHASGE